MSRPASHRACQVCKANSTTPSSAATASVTEPKARTAESCCASDADNRSVYTPPEGESTPSVSRR
ncbi:hypothetical protein [Melittangium boletus]|uniref:hypothetical protein n=1 Tax=Melittangium boletus TaxID=83453 RepID=UPI0012FEC126|nr:hypothetical protein [Melittangium boletus]